MNDFLARFRALKTEDQKIKFLIEINARIESSAHFTEQLKKWHYIFNKETNDLCIVKEMVLQQTKESI